MKNTLIIIVIILSLNACQSSKKESHTDKEVWIDLFNGKDLTGWDIKIAGHEVNDNYKNTFIVQDSMIRVSYDNYDNFDNKFGHMYYHVPFSYYKLSFDYRFTGEQLVGGSKWNVRNSGIMLHSQSAASNEIGQNFPVSIELQLLGGLGTEDRNTANVCTPGTAVVMQDTINFSHCIKSNSATYHGDQWVHVDATVMGGASMEFIVENDAVLRFENPQINGGFISEKQEGKDWDKANIIEDKERWISKKGTLLTEGYIALQAESHPVDFKNLKLLNLCGCMDSTAVNYKSYYVKSDPKQCKY
ncbi:MAG: DUF1080 domain-containing protein [Algibacter sp.]|uniref:3-keto-disaccharide hydrolase n=1 Tax=Algibacter sp. TaxID=1872428 RepID=UPI00262E0E33|nr:DUF1080 domain-containing protein [Algibacter sp.]MDG1730326.1 DUF1080 domain-containing protein [Algibacter sp.]MDG2178065.1 DUF1080 domain-containing protein [Algibacter sp.]